MEARIVGIETAFSQQQNVINKLQSDFQIFGKQMESSDNDLRIMLNEYDSNLKATIQTIKSDTEGGLTDNAQRIKAIESEMQTQKTTLDGLQATAAILSGFTQNDLGYLKTFATLIQQVPGFDLSQWVMDTKEAKSNIGFVKTQVDQIEQQIRNQPGGFQSGYGGTTKAIMDHKVWDSVLTLTSNRAGFRDWKKKFRSALRQCSRVKGIKEMLDFLERAENIQKASKLNRQMIMTDFEKHCQTNGIPQGFTPKDWEQLEREVEDILMAKCEDSS